MEQLILIIHFAATWFMVGVIWLVQLGQYPLFAYVDPHSFSRYYSRYSKSICYVVLVPMLVEFITAALIVKLYAGSAQSLLSMIGLGFVILIWFSTFLIQVPQHQKLKKCFDADTQKRLVVTNWVRTGLWTLRGILITALILK